MDNDRRNFLKLALAATICTAACPHIVLGRLTPEIIDKGEKISGVYTVKISQFPILNDLWGSVRMEVIGIDPLIHYPKIIVTRTPKDDYLKDFTCVTEMCPHEGNPVETLNPLTLRFECKKGHGSLYDPDGKFFSGVSKKDLPSYILDYPGGDNIYIIIDALITSKNENSNNSLSFLSQNFPNPCSGNTTIRFGLEKQGFSEISIYDLSGNKLKEIFSGYVDSGSHELNFDTSGLLSGTYFYKLITNNNTTIVRNMKVTR